MEFGKLIDTRRSCRSFTGETITKSQLDYILYAAVHAPSACNLQSWHFTAVCDKAVINKFYPDLTSNEWISKSAVIIIVSTDKEGIEKLAGERGRDLFSLQDTACAMENILLAAADIGLGGCFIGAFNEEKCREKFNLGERYRPVAIAAIGVPTALPPMRERKPMEDVVDIIGELPEDEAKSAESENKPYELRCGSYPNAVFDDLNLSGAKFNNINLSNSRFNDINISNSTFSDMNFTGSAFGGLCMNETKFGCVDMMNAEFDNPDLTGTKFKNCRLENVVIEDCDVSGMTINGRKIEELI